MKEKELYWLAGILEGEGSFVVHYKNVGRRPVFRITLGMTDKDIVLRCKNVTGLGNVCEKGLTSTGKQMWMWQVGKVDDVISIMMLVYPIMGERRQDKIRELMYAWRETPTIRERAALRKLESVKNFMENYNFEVS